MKPSWMSANVQMFTESCVDVNNARRYFVIANTEDGAFHSDEVATEAEAEAIVAKPNSTNWRPGRAYMG